MMENALQSIAELDYVGDVRQKGMMVGIELVENKSTGENFDPAKRIGAKLCQHLRSMGVILRPLGDVIVLMPPLAIQEAQLTELLRIVSDSIQNDLANIRKISMA